MTRRRDPNASTQNLEDQEDKKDTISKSADLVLKFQTHGPDYHPGDDLLEWVGGWNRYQALHGILFILICAFHTYSHYSPNLYLFVPQHHCHIPSSSNKSSLELRNLFIPLKDNRSLEYDECRVYDVNYDEILEEGIKVPDPSWNITSCKYGWVYYREEYFISPAIEFNWVCEHSWKGPFTQLLYFLGSTIGACIFGWVGDYIGRYWSVVSLSGILFISGSSLGFTNGLVTFSIARFFMGIATKIILYFSYILVLEFVSCSKRTVTGNVGLAFGISIPGTIMPYAFHWIGYWRTFNHVLFFQMIVVLSFPFVFYESFSWLLVTERYKDAFKVLKSVGRFNKRGITNEDFELVKTCYIKEFTAKDNVKTGITSVFELVTKKRLRNNFLILVLTWSAVTLLFDAHIQNVVNLDFSIYTSFAISAAVEAPADIIVIWLLDFIGRRWTTSLSMVISGVSMMIAFILVEFEFSPLIIMIVSMIGRFFITITMNGAMQIVPEILPTDLRSRGSAIVFVIGEVLTLVSPYIVYSAIAYKPMPFLLMGLIGSILGLLPLLLPETSNSSLATSADDADHIGRNQTFKNFPFAYKNDPKINNDLELSVDAN
ncbi:organic cation transporter 1 [Lepeophtheirus salmonis]|uniref:organic cation transporter 1 n=1 Tax=Lepeophtheirus salmonis TaxID=72036 RepID=UPI001AE471E1|nr:organic cation transporter 1-like [Lepeophtheirus salmonis]